MEIISKNIKRLLQVIKEENLNNDKPDKPEVIL
jgi:hypothetical protein